MTETVSQKKKKKKKPYKISRVAPSLRTKEWVVRKLQLRYKPTPDFAFLMLK